MLIEKQIILVLPPTHDYEKWAQEARVGVANKNNSLANQTWYFINITFYFFYFIKVRYLLYELRITKITSFGIPTERYYRRRNISQCSFVYYYSNANDLIFVGYIYILAVG